MYCEEAGHEKGMKKTKTKDIAVPKTKFEGWHWGDCAQLKKEEVLNVARGKVRRGSCHSSQVVGDLRIVEGVRA